MPSAEPTNHPALSAGNVAVVTGAASGIGFAAATRFAGLGMKVVLADLPGAARARRAPHWAADDIVEDRPALSRWHPDYKEAFAAFVKDLG